MKPLGHYGADKYITTEHGLMTYDRHQFIDETRSIAIYKLAFPQGEQREMTLQEANESHSRFLKKMSLEHRVNNELQ